MGSEMCRRDSKTGIQYEKVNQIGNPEKAVKHRVRTVPTVILLENEEEIKRTIGFNPEELKEIVEML